MQANAFAQCQSSGHAHSDVRAPTVGVFREQDEEEEEDEEPGAAERCASRKKEPKSNFQKQFKKKKSIRRKLRGFSAFGERGKRRSAPTRSAAGRRRCGTSCRQHTRGATVPSTDRCLTPQQQKKALENGHTRAKKFGRRRGRTSSLARGGLLPPNRTRTRGGPPRLEPTA